MMTIKANGDHVVAADHDPFDMLMCVPPTFVRVPGLTPADLGTMGGIELSKRARSAISQPVGEVGDALSGPKMTTIGGR